MTSLRVEISELRELFEVPAYDPLARRFEREPAIERALEQLEAAPLARTLEIVTAAPGTPSPDEVRAAIVAYCAAERREAERSVKLTRRRGRQALWIGLPVLAVCLAISGLSSSWSNAALASLISNSFVIAGWVAMWRPAELLLYDWWPFAQRARLLDRLARLEVRVVTP